MEAQSEHAILQKAKDAPFEVLEVSPASFDPQKEYEAGIRELLQDASITTLEKLQKALDIKFESRGRYSNYFRCYRASEQRSPLETDHSGQDSGGFIKNSCDGFVKLGDLVIRCGTDYDYCNG